MSAISGISGYDRTSLYTNGTTDSVTGTASANALQETLNSTNLEQATDEELMDVCKSFESYFVEQVLKEAKKMTNSEDEENDYLQYFGDTLLQEYSDTITESGDLGIANMLYESMKRNGI